MRRFALTAAVCCCCSSIAATVVRPYPTDPLWTWGVDQGSVSGMAPGSLDVDTLVKYSPDGCTGGGSGEKYAYSCPSHMMFSADFIAAAKADGNDWATYGVASVWGASSAEACGRCYQIRDQASTRTMIVQGYTTNGLKEGEFGIYVSGAGTSGGSSACSKSCSVVSNACSTSTADKHFCNAGMYDGLFLPWISKWSKCSGSMVGQSESISGAASTAASECLALLTQKDSSKWSYAEATLMDTCAAAVANGYSAGFPKLEYVEVQCPLSLTQVTGLRLVDDSVPVASESIRYTGTGLATVVQNCCKPLCAYGVTPSRAGVTVDPNLPATYSCLADGTIRVLTPNVPPPGANKGILPMRGTNLAGAEFLGGAWGDGVLPGKFGKDYTYPDPTYGDYYNVDYFLAKGMNLFRIPFRWERIQPSRTEPLDADELERLTSTVTSVTSRQAYALIGPHNYCRYKMDGYTYPNKDPLIGSKDLPISHFRDFWTRVATEFKDNPLVLFSVMNEPHDVSTDQWLAIAQAGIDAIRSTGATNKITVSGVGWGSTWWFSDLYATDYVKILKLKDPLNNLALDLHMYFDESRSGLSPDCIAADTGVTRINEATPWFREHNFTVIVSEFGAGISDVCITCMDNFLTYLEDNGDVFIGWSYWASGPWIITNVERDADPNKDGSDKKVWAALDKHTGEKTAWSPRIQKDYHNKSNKDITPLDGQITTSERYVAIGVGMILVLLCLGGGAYSANRAIRKGTTSPGQGVEKKAKAPKKREQTLQLGVLVPGHGEGSSCNTSESGDTYIWHKETAQNGV